MAAPLHRFIANVTQVDNQVDNQVDIARQSDRNQGNVKISFLSRDMGNVDHSECGWCYGRAICGDGPSVRQSGRQSGRHQVDKNDRQTNNKK